jgi:hypothetical protein
MGGKTFYKVQVIGGAVHLLLEHEILEMEPEEARSLAHKLKAAARRAARGETDKPPEWPWGAEEKEES